MSDKVLRTRRIPNEDRLEAIIALLRAEVRAWRDCVSPSDAVTTRMQTCVEDAIAATDAAGALEDK